MKRHGNIITYAKWWRALEKVLANNTFVLFARRSLYRLRRRALKWQ